MSIPFNPENRYLFRIYIESPDNCCVSGYVYESSKGQAMKSVMKKIKLLEDEDGIKRYYVISKGGNLAEAA